MFFTTLILASALVAIFPDCLAGSLDELKPFLNKSYKLVESDSNFGLVLQKLGIKNEILRRFFETVQPTMELEWDQNTEVYTLCRQSEMLNDIVSFKLDKEFNVTTVDGRQVLTTFTVYGTTLEETQSQPGKPTLIIRRHFEPSSVIALVEIENIISYRIYEAV